MNTFRPFGVTLTPKPGIRTSPVDAPQRARFEEGLHARGMMSSTRIYSQHDDELVFAHRQSNTTVIALQETAWAGLNPSERPQLNGVNDAAARATSPDRSGACVPRGRRRPPTRRR